MQLHYLANHYLILTILTMTTTMLTMQLHYLSKTNTDNVCLDVNDFNQLKLDDQWSLTMLTMLTTQLHYLAKAIQC